MASPPYQGGASPPGPKPLALPRQRPTLALPTGRKSSLAPSTASGSAHPLRQTSFPPADSLEAQHQLAEDRELRNAQYSPGATSEEGLDDLSDTEITSAISGPVGDAAFAGSKKRKRGGEKVGRGRGRKGAPSRARTGSVSLVNGEEGLKGRTPTAGAPSVVTGEADDEEDDDDEEGGLGARGDAFTMDPAEIDRENQRKYLFREAVPVDHQNRYDSYNKVKLRVADVRKLVNATLSQSVPQNVVTVVGAYTKMFAGMLIEGAREAQAEWMAANPTRPDGEEQQAYKRLKLMQPDSEDEDEDEDDEDDEPDTQKDADKEKSSQNGETTPKTPNGISTTESPVDVKPIIKQSQSPPNSLGSANANGTQSTPTLPNGSQSTLKDSPPDKKRKKHELDLDDLPDDFGHVQPGAWGLSKYIEECDRGPLQPDHLREALRRYKKSRAGGNVGFTGISMFGVDGRDVAAPRIGGGGKRMFR